MKSVQKNKASLVRGVGTNDINQPSKTPSYRRWIGILSRCYSSTDNIKNFHYQDCYVCDEWLVFSNFKRWFDKQEAIHGDLSMLEVDKDILIHGNKIYSPDSCLMVHRKVNAFFNDHRSASGKYKLGCYYQKEKGMFMARCGNPLSGKREYLGLFATEDRAHEAWRDRKREILLDLINSEYVNYSQLKVALTMRVSMIE